jgi:hypothetical protein
MNGNGSLDQELSTLEIDHQERAKVQLWQIIGASKLANQIASSLGSQNIRALESVRDDELYKAAKFDTFDKFLDQHPESPMSYESFRRRANLLKNEGDIGYDLLNSLHVPLSQRKLLAGQIEVFENEIKIGDDSVRLDDTARIVELISKLHKKDQEQQRTIERGKKDVDKLKQRAIEAETRAINANPDGTETGQAVLTVAGSITRLREALEAASPEEKLALKEPIFTLLRNGQLELSMVLGVTTREEVADVKGSQNGDENDETAALLDEL